MTKHNIAKNSLIMSVAVFLSRILGLVRDLVMAYFFGTTYASDAFYIAFNIPNLLRRLFGEGALSAAFVPIYNEFGIKRGKKSQLLFASNVLSILTFFLLVLSILGVLLAPILVRVLYPGSGEQTTALAIKLCRLIFPYLFFIGLSSTFIAILNSHNKFFITGLSSGLLNIGWILMLGVGSFLVKNDMDDLIFFAGYGVLLGGFLQTIINLPFLKQVGYRLRVILRFNTIAMKTLWRRFLPAMIGLGVREINLIADTLIASFLFEGSISALGLANRLMQLPLGIFGISVGTALLPEYSRQFTEKRWDDISETLRFSIHLILYILVPISVILIMGSDVFIRLIYMRGEFGERSVEMTSLALIFYTIGLCFYGLNQVVTPLFYAAKDTKTPVKIATGMVALNIALSVSLMLLWQPKEMALSGVALATSACAIVQFVIMVFFIQKKLPQVKTKNYTKNLVKLGCIIALQMVVLRIFDMLYVSSEMGFLFYLIKSGLFVIIGVVFVAVMYYALRVEYFLRLKSFKGIRARG